jgi:desulfoferrodoxin-like iron-binding protein
MNWNNFLTTHIFERRYGKMVKVKYVDEVYRCKVCGNIVEVKESGYGELSCCGHPMEMIEG